jgi:bifunctional DNase/RNase
MELSRILIRERNDYQIIELREVGPDPDAEPGPDDSRRKFPIVIGLPEAQAINRRLRGETIKRPQTHDLLGNVIQELGGKLQSITITDLAEHTFFATLDVKRDGGEVVHIDSRPSDAIAIGIANDVPIYVEEHVLDAALSEDDL